MTVTRKWRAIVVGSAVLASVVVSVVLIVGLSTPGFQKTVEDVVSPKKPLNPSGGALEVYRQPWDSNAVADWPVAEALAMLSDAAYLPPVDIEEKYLSLGFSRVKTFVDASMVGYVLSVDDVVVIVFRGTDDQWDWFANLDQLSTDTRDGAIHRGFWNGYQPLMPQIRKLINKPRPKHLWITGHSLGGALALVCAYDLLNDYDAELRGLVTFGQPMVAHSQLANHLDRALSSRYAHFVNESDIVPRVPPLFSHCGSLVWFKNGSVRRSVRRPLAVGAVGAAGPQDESDEPDEPMPLTEGEFERLQASAKAKNDGPDRLPDGTPIVKASIPWIEDHSMRLYLDQLRSVRVKPFEK